MSMGWVMTVCDDVVDRMTRYATMYGMYARAVCVCICELNVLVYEHVMSAGRYVGMMYDSLSTTGAIMLCYVMSALLCMGCRCWVWYDGANDDDGDLVSVSTVDVDGDGVRYVCWYVVVYDRVPCVVRLYDPTTTRCQGRLGDLTVSTVVGADDDVRCQVMSVGVLG